MRDDKEVMDEFEFKPLSDGLGFHQRVQEAKKASMAMIGPEVTPALPRREDRKAPVAPAPSTNEMLNKLNERAKLDFTEVTKRAKAPEVAPPLWKSAVMDPAAAFLDLMLISAGYLMCLILLIATTHIDLFANLLQPDSQGMIFIALGSLMAGLIWIYLVANRLFLGYTPGEWVFDSRLGTPEQFKAEGYGYKVMARTLILMATGVITLPLISFLMNKDYVGQWLNLELIKKA